MNRRILAYMILFGMFVFTVLDVPFAVLASCITGQQLAWYHMTPAVVGFFLTVLCWLEISTLRLLLGELQDTDEGFELQPTIIVGVVVSIVTAAVWGMALKRWPTEAFNVLPWHFVTCTEIIRRVTIYVTDQIANFHGIRLR